jgi:chemotaxis protein methyltransferase CheR
MNMLSITTKEFTQLASFIKENYGINLKEEKMALLAGRLYNVIQQGGFDSFGDYYDYIIKDKSGEAVITLVNKITTNHTYFMRESDHFHYFKEHVLPYLITHVKNKDLCIWCAACSSGEESYTLAMLIDEYFGNSKCKWDTKILATDISEKVLEAARLGIYSEDRVTPLPDIWKKVYFKNNRNGTVTITDRIKNEVIYRKFNLMEPSFPFKKKFHVIFCRNVMIYFDVKTKEELIDKFYESMEYGGYLFIGHSESLNRETTRFKYVCPSVYRKI